MKLAAPHARGWTLSGTINAHGAKILQTVRKLRDTLGAARFSRPTTAQSRPKLQQPEWPRDQVTAKSRFARAVAARTHVNTSPPKPLRRIEAHSF